MTDGACATPLRRLRSAAGNLRLQVAHVAQGNSSRTVLVMIDGATVTLETVGYRNFQPSPQPNHSLALVMRLRTASAAVRNGLTVTSVSATSTASGEHWTSSAIQRGVLPDQGADYVEFVVHDGPAWPVGSSCAVTVSVRSVNGTVATLGNAGVVITSVS